MVTAGDPSTNFRDPRAAELCRRSCSRSIWLPPGSTGEFDHPSVPGFAKLWENHRVGRKVQSYRLRCTLYMSVLPLGHSPIGLYQFASEILLPDCLHRLGALVLIPLFLPLMNLFVFAFVAPLFQGLPEVTTPELEILGTPFARTEVRANAFTASGQNAVALAREESGDTVLVWHSRRQQDGTYGIYGRRFSPSGVPLTGEVTLNLTQDQMQMHPSVATDGKGGVWVSWTSFAQDGHLGGIVARRFAPDLAQGTNEILINEIREGDQSEALVLGLEDGGAMIFWLSNPGGTIAQTELWGRRVRADGTVQAKAFRVDKALENQLPRTPSVALSGDVICVTYAFVDDSGRAAGVEAVRIRLDGTPVGKPQKVDSPKSKGIEPTVTATESGAFAIAWLEPVAGQYAIRWRAQDAESEWQGIHQVATGKAKTQQGYLSGLEIACNGKDILVAWNRYGGGPKNKPGIFAQVVKLDGTPVEPTFRVTQHDAGPQAIAVARGTRKVHFARDQTMAFGWHGDADLGDGSGAHLTVLGPKELLESNLTLAPSPLPQDTQASLFEPQGAAPTHQPPVFDASLVDLDRTEPANFGPGGGVDFLGITSTGWTPPDPEMAVGPNHIVVVTNGAIGWLTKSGTLQFQDELEDSNGFWGTEGATNFVFDPEAIFDPHSQRFIAMANERSGTSSFFLIAVSDDDDPNGTWYKYRINVTPLIGANIDSPNIGVDDEAIYLTADFFGPDRLFVYAIDKSSVLNGGTLSATNLTLISRQSMGTPVNFDANSPAQYLLWAPETSISNSLRIFALTDPLGALTSQFVDIPVPQYSQPANPPQAGSSIRPGIVRGAFLELRRARWRYLGYPPPGQPCPRALVPNCAEWLARGRHPSGRSVR